MVVMRPAGTRLRDAARPPPRRRRRGRDDWAETVAVAAISFLVGWGTGVAVVVALAAP